MGTLYPTERERRAIQKSADQGDESARDYLDLLNACTQVREGSNGVSLARAFVGEHDDVYGQSVDDALSELMPVIFRVSAGGWDSLKFYVPEEMQREAQESMDRLKQAVAHSEALKWLKLTLEEDKEEIDAALTPPKKSVRVAVTQSVMEEDGKNGNRAQPIDSRILGAQVGVLLRIGRRHWNVTVSSV